MISVLGLELGQAVELLKSLGYETDCIEVRSRKGLAGNEARVVRQRISGGRAELTYAIFKTDCDFGG